MVIRKATLDDHGDIVAFNQAMAAETEDKQLPDELINPGVRAVLSDETKGFYLVAEVEGEIAASLMVTYEWSDWRNGTFYWIQSVYVRPENRRQGLYSALYEEVKRRAEINEDVCGYRLYVEKDNNVAQKTYEALGMKETVYYMYESKKSG